MWLLEQDGDVFGGRHLWLRPGQLYLFGRTASEPGQLAISHKTISRKHMTIRVGAVKNGDSENLSARSQLIIEDLATKTGTTVGDQKFKGETFELTEPGADIRLGSCPDLFRISWHPVALTFSFSSREMQADPFRRLRGYLEQLDIKISPDYDVQRTTHVVTKKRNTPKGLQALINGKYIVTDAFVDAIVVAAQASTDTETQSPASSLLEQDFEGNWPDPLLFLPPRGGEPVERPVDAYAPDASRQEIFEGYTFIFYDMNQFDNLLAPITNGKGKALYMEVKPAETTVDDFVRFVKTEAGEKGLGSFEDGSEGRGVVVVRFTPNKGGHMEWYGDFFRDVSLRLDHRPIEQNEFLEAILVKDASILRRPLEDAVEEESRPVPSRPVAPSASRSAMYIDQPTTSQETSQSSSALSAPAARRGRTRRAATRRFAGFASDDNDDAEQSIKPDPPTQNAPEEAEEHGLFVSQEPELPSTVPYSNSRAGRSLRKRPAETDDIMDGIMPTAEAVKRRRIEAGEEPIPRRSPSIEEDPKPSKETKAPPKKVKEIDVLEEARKRREALEARAKAEQEDLANMPSDIDLESIRRLHIIEEIEIRRPARGDRDRDQDIADGRWDPRWNGRKNFKRFRQRGAAAGRAPGKVIVSLTEVKKKDFGIGDDYWLEDGADKQSTQRSGGTQSQAEAGTSSAAAPATAATATSSGSASRRPARAQQIVLSDDSSDEEPTRKTATPAGDEDVQLGPISLSRGSRNTGTETQSTGTAPRSSRSQTQNSRGSQATKRAAPPPSREPAAKKPRATRRAVEVQDSDDDSDDELKFKFGRRR